MAADDIVDILEVDPIYCTCKQPYDDTRFMIECDVCKDWFHGECVGVEEHQAAEIDIYHCPNCQQSHGPLQLKIKRRKNKFSIDPLDTGVSITKSTKKFLKSLKSRTFLSGKDLVDSLRGYQLDKQYMEENGFNKPLLIEDAAGLDISVPPPSFSVNDVELLIGSMRELDVIDVAKQSDAKMLMREFVEYYNSPKKDKILNVISLEFSQTKLSDLVTAPRIVSELSWVARYWPEHTGETRTFLRPEVQKYCLMSVKDSYTDFHVDFGGTSVWYHIIHGQKIFYLIEPTDANMALYETWISSSSQNTIFFGDQVDACYKLVIDPGQTLFIPTGWIHGVYTPKDSLVFGGNFLHDHNIKLQLDIFEMENRIATPTRFQFPNFETLCWFAAKSLMDDLKESIEDNKVLNERVISGCEALVARLNSWMTASDSKQAKRHREYLPEGIAYTKLLRQFSKVIFEARQSLTARNTSENVEHDRKALLGLKFKLNKLESSLLRIKESPPPATTPPSKIKTPNSDSESDESSSEERKLKSCFSDGTYVYPSLLDSDDDAHQPPIKKKKTNSDAWASKTKVSKPSDLTRPRRQSADRQRKQIQSQTQRVVNKPPSASSKPKVRKHKPKLITVPKPETSSTSSAVTEDYKSKVKKGHKTAKQRLGKLLKIHKYNL